MFVRKLKRSSFATQQKTLRLHKEEKLFMSTTCRLTEVRVQSTPLNLGTRNRRKIKYTTWPLHPRQRTRYPVNRGLSGPQKQSWPVLDSRVIETVDSLCTDYAKTEQQASVSFHGARVLISLGPPDNRDATITLRNTTCGGSPLDG